MSRLICVLVAWKTRAIQRRRQRPARTAATYHETCSTYLSSADFQRALAVTCIATVFGAFPHWAPTCTCSKRWSRSCRAERFTRSSGRLRHAGAGVCLRAVGRTKISRLVARPLTKVQNCNGVVTAQPGTLRPPSRSSFSTTRLHIVVIRLQSLFRLFDSL